MTTRRVPNGLVTITFPWPAPPLRSNARLNRWDRARLVADIRRDAFLVGRSMHGSEPVYGPVRVRMVWTVTDRRIRDAGASSPTLKAAMDGLVDAGILPADDWQAVPEESCRIELGDRPGCRIEITPDGA